ncbi:MAG: DUF1573 domain-containing protein [Deltaproteobacteria bacterium]|nr:DUF1573 domain-containing protein [Deltaproteobacteria bacterium]
MAHFDRVIPPGGEGEIRLSAQTRGYVGTFRKKARVFTNDLVNPVAILELKALIKSAIYVSSSPVYLYLKAGQSMKRIVEIRAGLERPLKLTPRQFDLSEKLAYTIEEIEKGRRFKISLTTIAGASKNYFGYLKLATNYPEKPEISIRIYGRFPKEKQKKGSSRSGN